MKKGIAAILSLVMALSLAACGSTQPTPTEASAPKPVETTAPVETAPAETAFTEAAAETAAPETEEAQSGKTLVVYYSATGNTEGVAHAIADTTGGDLFELTPVQPYTSADLNWTNENSRVSVEHDDPQQRYVELTQTLVENWDAYDTVFIGYPIWWGIAAWPVNEFVTNNDFTGKTVIPFATSSSSGLGESGELLSQMAGTGDWLEGARFSSGASAEDVSAWVRDLGLSN